MGRGAGESAGESGCAPTTSPSASWKSISSRFSTPSNPAGSCASGGVAGAKSTAGGGQPHILLSEKGGRGCAASYVPRQEFLFSRLCDAEGRSGGARAHGKWAGRPVQPYAVAPSRPTEALQATRLAVRLA